MPFGGNACKTILSVSISAIMTNSFYGEVKNMKSKLCNKICGVSTVNVPNFVNEIRLGRSAGTFRVFDSNITNLVVLEGASKKKANGAN